MLAEHDLVIHLVDVVARQNEEEFRPVAVDDVDVLGDCVRRAEIPLLLRNALRGREDVEELVPFGPEEIPPALQVPDQAVRLVLGCDADAPDTGIDRVREREVDDAAVAAEKDGRFRPFVRQLLQAAAAAAREHEGHGLLRQARTGTNLHVGSSLRSSRLRRRPAACPQPPMVRAGAPVSTAPEGRAPAIASFPAMAGARWPGSPRRAPVRRHNAGRSC